MLINEKEYSVELTDKFAFFLKGELSNWHYSPFVVGTTGFRTTEQFFCFQKAVVFGDMHTAEMILASEHPKEAKNLGSKVKGFNQEIWDQLKFGIMWSANYHKFNYHAELQEILMATKDRLIVECNPYDKIWSCGLSMSDKNIEKQDKWTGKNLLGLCLTNVRESLIFKTNHKELF